MAEKKTTVGRISGRAGASLEPQLYLMHDT